MVQGQPSTPLAGMALGATIACGLFSLEVVTRGSPWSGWGFCLAIALGIAAGGAVGGLTARVRRWPLLAALVLAPTALASSTQLHWALRRGLELIIRQHTQTAFTGIHILLVATLGLASAALCLGALKHFPRLGKRPLAKWLTVAIVLSLAAQVGLFLYESDALELGVWIAVAWVALFGVLFGLGRWTSALACLGLVASVAALQLLPVRYQSLLSAFAAFAFGFALLLGRRRLPKLLAGDSNRRQTWAAALCVLFAAVIGERIVTIYPTAWRVRASSGALSGALFALRSTTDFDADGYGLLFGTRDCAPFDGARGPHQHETLGNGVDDNCVGGSADPRDPPFLQSIDASLPRPAPEAAGRDLILYVVDALRHDDTVKLRPEGFATFLDQSVVFDRAYSTSTFTSQAMMGHLAGRLPSTTPMVVVHEFNAYPSPVPKGLPHYLGEHGFDTGLAGGMDCDEGSDCSTSAYFLPVSYGDGFRVARLVPRGGTSEDVLHQARRAWSELDPEKPRFLWIHDLSVHDAEATRESYRGKVREAAKTFGLLREEIAPDAVWVLTSDHGEEFLEHASYRHAQTLYDEVLRIPLAVQIPGHDPERISNVCSARSLMPTLVALLGVDVGPPGLGPFLCLASEGCLDQPAPAALELGELHLHALVLGNRKIIRDIGQGLLFSFELAVDPDEKHPSFYPPTDLASALVEWEEHAFGNRDDASVWPYRGRSRD